MTKLETATNAAIEEVRKYASAPTKQPFKFSPEATEALTESMHSDRKMTDPGTATTGAINWGQLLTNLESTITFLVNAGTQVLPFLVQIIQVLPKSPVGKPFGVPLKPEDHHAPAPAPVPAPEVKK